MEMRGKLSSHASPGRPSHRNSGPCATTGDDRSLGLGADETGVVYRVEIKMVEESETYFEQCVVDIWPEKVQQKH
jgi:hypothetical protein